MQPKLLKFHHLAKKDGFITWEYGWNFFEELYKPAQIHKVWDGFSKWFKTLGSSYGYFIVNKIQLVFTNFSLRYYTSYEQQPTTTYDKYPTLISEDHNNRCLMRWYKNKTAFQTDQNKKLSANNSELAHEMVPKRTSKLKWNIYPKCRDRARFIDDNTGSVETMLHKCGADIDWKNHEMYFGWGPFGYLPDKSDNTNFARVSLSYSVELYVTLTLSSRTVEAHW